MGAGIDHLLGFHHGARGGPAVPRVVRLRVPPSHCRTSEGVSCPPSDVGGYHEGWVSHSPSSHQFSPRPWCRSHPADADFGAKGLHILSGGRAAYAMRSPQTQPVTTKAQERSRPAAHEPMYNAPLSRVRLWSVWRPFQRGCSARQVLLRSVVGRGGVLLCPRCGARTPRPRPAWSG